MQTYCGLEEGVAVGVASVGSSSLENRPRDWEVGVAVGRASEGAGLGRGEHQFVTKVYLT